MTFPISCYPIATFSRFNHSKTENNQSFRSILSSQTKQSTIPLFRPDTQTTSTLMPSLMPPCTRPSFENQRNQQLDPKPPITSDTKDSNVLSLQIIDKSAKKAQKKVENGIPSHEFEEKNDAEYANSMNKIEAWGIKVNLKKIEKMSNMGVEEMNKHIESEQTALDDKNTGKEIKKKNIYNRSRLFQKKVSHKTKQQAPKIPLGQDALEVSNEIAAKQTQESLVPEANAQSWPSFNKSELNYLQMMSNINPVPTKDQLRKIAKSFKRTEAQIQAWFNSQRKNRKTDDKESKSCNLLCTAKKPEKKDEGERIPHCKREDPYKKLCTEETKTINAINVNHSNLQHFECNLGSSPRDPIIIDEPLGNNLRFVPPQCLNMGDTANLLMTRMMSQQQNAISPYYAQNSPIIIIANNPTIITAPSVTFNVINNYIQAPVRYSEPPLNIQYQTNIYCPNSNNNIFTNSMPLPKNQNLGSGIGDQR